jgi:aspartate/methionine/tyrosine aminotransferase
VEEAPTGVGVTTAPLGSGRRGRPHLTRDSVEFCCHMLDETGVATTPGRDFDPIHGDNWIRLYFAGSTEDIAEACRRLAMWLPGTG